MKLYLRRLLFLFLVRILFQKLFLVLITLCFFATYNLGHSRSWKFITEATRVWRPPVLDPSAYAAFWQSYAKERKRALESRLGGRRRDKSRRPLDMRSRQIFVISLSVRLRESRTPGAYCVKSRGVELSRYGAQVERWSAWAYMVWRHGNTELISKEIYCFRVGIFRVGACWPAGLKYRSQVIANTESIPNTCKS